MVLMQILVATFVVSLISVVGVFTLNIKQALLNRLLLVLVALSAGGLLGGAFLHLMPDAVETAGNSPAIYLVLLLGFCLFFVLEQFLLWRHEHGDVHSMQPFSYLVLLGDTLHNFVDGLVIAGSFLIGFPVGIATTVAVALHEIPQELGDFGILVYGGLSPKRALAFNYISALGAILGGILGYLSFSLFNSYIVYILPFAAGNFIYIAAADLIPEIKLHVSPRRSALHFMVFIAGMGIMLLLKLLD